MKPKYARWLILAVAAALLPLLPSPQTTNAAMVPSLVQAYPPRGCVDLYQDDNHGGERLRYCRPVNVASLSAHWNDRISSIYVGYGRHIWVFTESGYRGARRCFPGNTYVNSLRAFRIDWRKTWNDIISSFQIHNGNNC